MDGRLDGRWTNECIDGQMHGWLDELMSGSIDEWIDRWTGISVDWRMDGAMDG